MTDRSAIITTSSDDPRKRGMGGDALIECYPEFAERDGDNVITGENNTWIVLGRDRTPASNSNKSHAGAIDIVVGRYAPTPIGAIPSAQPNQSPAVYADPIFNTYVEESLTSHKLANGENHSGVIMDAARIYISQTTDIDAAFQLNPGLSNSSPKKFESPRSAIGMKADEIRIISRQGIKLVTGPLSDKDRVNSQGGDIASTYGIDLMAANGITPIEGELSEPLVKGTKLTIALKELSDLVSDVTGIVATLFQVQFAFNIATAAHIPPEIVLLGFPGVPSPVMIGHALPFYISETMSKVLPSMVNHKLNMGAYQLNFLTPTFEGYICSRYNSTN